MNTDTQFIVDEDGFAFTVVGSSLVVLRIPDGAPPQHLWDQYVETVGRVAADRTVRVFADGTLGGGRPHPTQRRQLSDAAPADRVRAAMITDNPIVRGVATVFRWLGYQNEAFSSRNVEQAFNYLWCDELERVAVLRLFPHLNPDG